MRHLFAALALVAPLTQAQTGNVMTVITPGARTVIGAGNLAATVANAIAATNASLVASGLPGVSVQNVRIHETTSRAYDQMPVHSAADRALWNQALLNDRKEYFADIVIVIKHNPNDPNSRSKCTGISNAVCAAAVIDTTDLSDHEYQKAVGHAYGTDLVDGQTTAKPYWHRGQLPCAPADPNAPGTQCPQTQMCFYTLGMTAAPLDTVAYDCPLGFTESYEGGTGKKVCSAQEYCDDYAQVIGAKPVAGFIHRFYGSVSRQFSTGIYSCTPVGWYTAGQPPRYAAISSWVTGMGTGAAMTIPGHQCSGWTHLPQWSNPDVKYPPVSSGTNYGAPTGTPARNEAKQIELNASRLTTFRNAELRALMIINGQIVSGP